ncbi:hypothetical protein AK830_g8933 [Neonectria ditissima]|uniref:NB-ARC domain-containing protein n=1 Tax=Neonectria ditissima TaxID=78410 RepID=A0A0P7BA62_9HYPO|nr:hypothetical protein AK830_g8933 [Neonectria ditissima]
MVNFFETRRLVLCKAYFWISHSVMIVTKDSATFEGDNTENHSLDYDHSGLNKYNSADDQGYRKIKFTLRQMMQLIVESRQRIQLKHDNDLASNSSSGIPPPNNKLVISSEYSVGPQTSPFFIERPTLRSLLEKYIRDADNTRVLPRSVALWGAGGAGKTQLALRFAEQHRHVYNPIIWVEADTVLSIINSYSRAFETLGLDFPSTVLDEERKDSKEDVTQLKNHWVIKSVLDYLESRTEAHSEWLVIINNADHLDLLPSTIPRGSRGSVIITTRDKMADRFVSHPIEVGDLSTDEAIELLLQGIPPSTGMFSELAVSSDEADHTDSSEKPASNVLQKRQAYAIIERLGHMAFPLALANSYIRQHDHVREDLSLYLSFVDRASFATLNTEGTTLFDPRHSSLASALDKRIQNGDTVWQSSSELLSSGLDYGAIMTASGAPFWLAVKAGVVDLGGYPIHFLVMAQTMLIIGATSLYESWHHKAVKRHTADLLDRLNFSGTDLSRFQPLLQDPSPDRTILKIIIAELRLVTFSLAFPVFLIMSMSPWSLLIQPGTILGDNWFWFNAQYLKRVKHHPLTRAGLSQLKRLFRFFLPLCDFVIPSIIVFIYPIAHNALDFTETFSLSHKMLSVVGESLEPQFLDDLLSHTDHLQWYAVPYSTAASHIARFGLLHRTHGEHGGGYTMHPLAKQWAQERLGILESNAVALESYRLIALAHRSPSCWDDVTCQRLLIPHLLSLATSGIVEADEEQGDIGTYKRTEHVLRMLCYSLMKLEEL